MYNPYANIEHMHHTAYWFPSSERWVITNQDCEIAAVVATSSVKHPKGNLGHKRTVTTCEITLLPGRCELPLDPITRSGGMRTALRWIMAQLNNGHLWLSTRLSLERKARLLDYSEPELLACEHAYDYQYCLRLLTNLPRLSGYSKQIERRE